MAIETAMPDVPSYEMNYGGRGNTMKIDLSRRGLLNATLGLVAKGANAPSAPAAPARRRRSTSLRFAQATGEIKQDGVQLGSVVGASLAYSNNLDKVETIRPTAKSKTPTPACRPAAATSRALQRPGLLDKATGRTRSLSFGWTFGAFSLLFTFERVLPAAFEAPITGPGGIQASFDWQASGADGTSDRRPGQRRRQLLPPPRSNP
jgi:hypothetical protein